MPATDARDEVATEDQVVPTEREQIGAVGALRRRRQPQQELWREVLEDPAIRPRLRVVELVDHDVVEVVGGEPVQVLGPRQGLHRCEEDLRIRITPLAHVASQRRAGTDAAEGTQRLFEDLLAMGDEQHALERR